MAKLEFGASLINLLKISLAPSKSINLLFFRYPILNNASFAGSELGYILTISLKLAIISLTFFGSPVLLNEKGFQSVSPFLSLSRFATSVLAYPSFALEIIGDEGYRSIISLKIFAPNSY